MKRPLMIDLFSGLGGWAEGGLAEGYDVVGFDIERHVYGEDRYPAQLVIQDVLTLHGSQFRDAALIVASPPCQEFSYMAMPWSRAKAKAAEIRADKTGEMLSDLNRLFDACFRIQREACEAAGRHIPTVVENVRGAIPWVGRSRWAFGSYHLWGDVPALMPATSFYGTAPGIKRSGRTFCYPAGSANPEAVQGRSGKLHWDGAPDGVKVPGLANGTFPPGGLAQGHIDGIKGVPHRTKGHRTNPAEHEGFKNGNDWFGSGETCSEHRRPGSKSNSRKAASAMIAKIPEPLSRHIASVYHPRGWNG